MAGFKYRTPGISKNKDIKKERKKPLPLSMMKINTTFCITCYQLGTIQEIANHKCLGKAVKLLNEKTNRDRID